jgi:hypothetical protein
VKPQLGNSCQTNSLEPIIHQHPNHCSRLRKARKAQLRTI